MIEASEDLWPSDFPNAYDPAPVALLKEQSELLRKKTKGEIEGVIRMLIEDNVAYHIMYLRATASELNDVMVAILMIKYSTFNNLDNVYPITASPPGEGGAGYGPSVTIANHDEFRKWLRDQLSSKFMLSRIGVLKNYIRELTEARAC